MDPSSARLTDPVSSPASGDRPQGERRHRVRHKLHTPVYVSFNGRESGMVVDLSELIDLNEDGFAVQTAPTNPCPAVDLALDGTPAPDANRNRLEAYRLEANHAVTICLDLPETKSFVHGSGLVAWRDETGRAGIRFSHLADRSLPVLKEWLFINLLIACANHVARSEQRARYRAEESAGNRTQFSSSDPPDSRPVSPPSGRARPLPALDELQRQIQEIEARDIEARTDSTDAILQLIVERAMELTRATGCAIALLTGERMICRARAGDPAPPLGSEVDVSQGLSGECVRTATAVLCADTAADSRVDSELCRALGLGSFLAVPVVSDFRAVGLIEVLSPNARAFSNVDISPLERLAEFVPHGRRGEKVAVASAAKTADTTEDKIEAKIGPDETKIDETELAATKSDRTSVESLTPEPPTPAPSAVEPHPAVAAASDVSASNPERETVPADHLAELRFSESQPGESESYAAGRQLTPRQRALVADFPASIEDVPKGDAPTADVPAPNIPVADVPMADFPTTDAPTFVSAPGSAAAVATPETVFSEPTSADSAAAEPIAGESLHQLRAALWDRAAAEETDVGRERDEFEPGTKSISRSHIVHLGLILSALAAVALALGYLLAPVIERHLGSVQASQNSPTQATMRADNSAATNSATNPVAAISTATRPKALTPEELRKLADQGDAEADWRLGTLYRNGDGVPQNDTKAVEWFQRAADRQYVPAFSALGSHYWAGRGVRQDYMQAYFWYQLAVAEGDQNSKPQLEGLATQLTQSQIATARQQAEAWLHAHSQPAKPASN